MDDIIQSVEGLTPERLTRILRTADDLAQGNVVAVDPQEAQFGVSQIFPLEVAYSVDAPESAPRRMILKLSAESRLGDAKEVIFYQTMMDAQADLPLIRCYDAAYSEATGRFHLLLEDLSATHESHPPAQLPPTLDRAEQIVDALAQFHAYWHDHANLDVAIATKPTEESIVESMQADAEAYAGFADYLGDRLSDERRKIIERAIERLPELVKARYLAGKNLTLTHGDPHIGNFLYPKDATRDKLRIIDWKSYGVQPGAEDIAGMIAVFWFPERRARFEIPLLKRYHARLLEGGVTGYDWDACWYDYRLAVIKNLLFPAWQWSWGGIVDVWWNHMERIFAAYHDLNCEAIVDGG
jgi:thiamine kinase-like enzyme